MFSQARIAFFLSTLLAIANAHPHSGSHHHRDLDTNALLGRRGLDVDAVAGEVSGVVAEVPHVAGVVVNDAVGAATHVGIGKRGADVAVGTCAALSAGVGGQLLDLVGLDIDADLCVCAEVEVVLGQKVKKYHAPPKISCGENEEPTCELNPVCQCKPGYEMSKGSCKPVNCPARAKVECNSTGACHCDCGGFNCDPLISVDTCAFVQADVAASLCKINVKADVEVCICASVEVGLGNLLNYHAPKSPACEGGHLTCSNNPTCVCPPGKILKDGKCGLGASQAPKKRESLGVRRLVCPDADEERCPISSSPTSGFECLDTKRSLESCGGCVVGGTGVNCLELPHVEGVTCDNGTCKVLSCSSDGFTLSNNVCVPII